MLTRLIYSSTPVQGTLPLLAAFLVALKQLVPEHTVAVFRGLIRMRVKHFPAVFVAANMLSGPLLGTDTALWLSLFGFLTSWIYLRFYRVTELTSLTAATGGEAARMTGDASDTFSFVAFFPDAMQPYLSPVCDAIYNVLVQLRICTPFTEEAIEAGNESAAERSSEGLPSLRGGGGDGRRAEAERRRALALKALDQRLSAAAAGRTVDASASAGAAVGSSAAVSTDVVYESGSVAAGSEPPVKEAQA